MTKFDAVRGDLKATVEVGLAGVADITGATVRGHVWQTGITPILLTGAVSRAVATATEPCAVLIQLGVDVNGWLATAAPGIWLFEQELTFPNGVELTWPDSSPDLIRVRAQGDPP